MANPLVSISCITYNHASFINQCLDGILMQKCSFPIEVLIHDDASTDGTADIIKKYEVLFPGIIKPVYQIENQYSKGIKPTFKYNLPRAKGKYVALCEGDDYWTDPLKLQKQVDYLEENPQFIGCFTNAIILNEGKESSKKFIRQSLPDVINFDIMVHKGGGIYPTPSLMFKNIKLKFPFSFQEYSAGDWALGLILTASGKLKFLDFDSCVYRKHSGGVYTSIENNKKLRRRMNIGSVYFLHDLNKMLEFRKDQIIRNKISDLSKKIILRSSGNKLKKENLPYFKQLNFRDFLSVLKHSLS